MTYIHEKIKLYNLGWVCAPRFMCLYPKYGILMVAIQNDIYSKDVLLQFLFDLVTHVHAHQ